MIKKVLLLLVSFSFIVNLSCSDDGEESCRKNGSLSATWSDGQALRFNHNVFTEKDAQTIGVQCFFDAEYCATRVALSVSVIGTSPGRQELKRYNGDGIFGLGTSRIRTLDTDAVTESYDLDTLRPHWIEINEAGPDRIRGVINATYALEEATVNKAWNFPDTLRFREEAFELVKRRE